MCMYIEIYECSSQERRVRSNEFDLYTFQVNLCSFEGFTDGYSDNFLAEIGLDFMLFLGLVKSFKIWNFKNKLL